MHEARLRSVPVQKASTWQKIAWHGRGSELFILLACGFPGLGLGTQRQLKDGRMHAGGEGECCEFDEARRRSPFLARAVPVTSFSVRSPTKKVSHPSTARLSLPSSTQSRRLDPPLVAPPSRVSSRSSSINNPTLASTLHLARHVQDTLTGLLLTYSSS